MHRCGVETKPCLEQPPVILRSCGVLTSYFARSILNGVVGHSKSRPILADLEITAMPLDSRLTEDRML